VAAWSREWPESAIPGHFEALGDSGIFVRRSVYEDLGGFRPIPLMEDLDFVHRLGRGQASPICRQLPLCRHWPPVPRSAHVGGKLPFTPSTLPLAAAI
jgi:hypothetical protein